jgi:energy-coupling factor transporter ATP-binding protein EcfA2
MIANDLSDLKTLSRHRIPVGDSGEGDKRSQAHIDPAGAGVLVAGTSGSGKSTLTTTILEGLADAGYQSLVIDPEGDYTNVDFAAQVGNPKQAPRPEDVTNALKDPKRSIVVNLLGLPLADRPKFFAQVLPRVLEEKNRTGRPHWLVIDEAHHLIPVEQDTAGVASMLPDRGLMFVTVHPGAVAPAALTNIGTLLVIGDHPAKTVTDFCKTAGASKPTVPAVEGDKLPTGDAVLWHRGEKEAVVIHTKLPRTERKRHSRKYAEGNLGPERSFYFRGPQGKLNLKASNLNLFLQMADGVDDETWEFHRKHGDFSKWVREQIKDEKLADELAAIERDRTPPPDARAAVRAAVEHRYTLPDDSGSAKGE